VRRLRFVLFLVGLVACAQVQGRHVPTGPVNVCPEHPCGGYDLAKGVNVECGEGFLCVVQQRTTRFFIVVNIPDTNLFARGQAFFLTDAMVLRGRGVSGCTPPKCLPLPDVSEVTGYYLAAQDAGRVVGVPMREASRIPVRVQYTPSLGATNALIPLGDLFATATRTEEGVQYVHRLPFGTYRRVLFPQPPYDESFPPAIVDQVTLKGATATDVFRLGAADAPLDDPIGDRRTATVTRDDGLDGWRVFIRDSKSKLRISSIRKLSGTMAIVRLDTVGQNDQTGNVRSNTEVVVEPPEDYVAVPRYETILNGGAELKSLSYLPLPAPVKATGQVASKSGTTLTGFPASLTFESDSIRTLDPMNPEASVLKYKTSVSTDELGRFATVVPPGQYVITIVPVAGTGYAVVRTSQSILAPKELTLLAEPKTKAHGIAVISDGRPLTYGDVIATPDIPNEKAIRPRAARARTDENGAFEMDLDPGDYVVTVVPQPGTGFPRFVTRHTVTPVEYDLHTLRVPPPIRLQLVEIREPNGLGPIVGAHVRVYADPRGGDSPPVEVASTTTGPDGQVEILLAPRPP